MVTLMQLSPEAIECMRRATKRGANSTLSEMWAVWRTLQDKVTAHKEYRCNGERTAKRLLLNLAKFNTEQMAIFNERQWRDISSASSFSGDTIDRLVGMVDAAIERAK